MATKRVVIRKGNTITVIRLGRTSNDKVALSDMDIVQTYHFSKAQYEYARSGQKGWKGLMSSALTADNCFSCPYQGGSCYTHNMVQASGFLSMLRSIAKAYPTWESIPTVTPTALIVEWCTSRYVRFGTYGEPVILPFQLVDAMAAVASSYSGYTHRWKNPLFKAYSRRLMASCDETDYAAAQAAGWRTFIAIPKSYAKVAVQCPASKEAGYKSHCAKCGLCSGGAGKGTVSIQIIIH